MSRLKTEMKVQKRGIPEPNTAARMKATPVSAERRYPHGVRCRTMLAKRKSRLIDLTATGDAFHHAIGMEAQPIRGAHPRRSTGSCPTGRRRTTECADAVLGRTDTQPPGKGDRTDSAVLLSASPWRRSWIDRRTCKITLIDFCPISVPINEVTCNGESTASSDLPRSSGVNQRPATVNA